MPRRKDKNADKYSKQNEKTNLGIGKIEPLTDTQADVFDAFDEDMNLMLHGVAGTGKTFVALYLAMKAIVNKVDQKKKVYIVRSVVPTRDMGFLPGTLEEKEDAYKAPYYSILTQLFEDHDAWKKIETAKQIEFLTTSFIRGITLTDSIVLIDESQNLTYHELCSVPDGRFSGHVHGLWFLYAGSWSCKSQKHNHAAYQKYGIIFDCRGWILFDGL